MLFYFIINDREINCKSAQNHTVVIVLTEPSVPGLSLFMFACPSRAIKGGN